VEWTRNVPAYGCRLGGCIRRTLYVDQAGRLGLRRHAKRHGHSLAKQDQRSISHAIDVAPTVLEAATLPEPKIVNGTPQTPIEGTSLVYTFDDAKAKERHTTQYFEMFGNRAIYHDGWLARTIHRAPGQTTKQKPLESDVWDLYDVGKKEFGKGGVATLSVNGKPVAEGRIEKTQPLIFSADETADVGLDNQTPVVEGIGIGPEETRFTGTIDKVVIKVQGAK